jgi:tRNA (cytidine/uridine-2'-O-)-methyltransferase
MFDVVLYQPEIPQNTGNIVRLCAATGCRLHLIGPLGFSLRDKYLKRAGLDYWPLAEVNYYDSFEQLRERYRQAIFYYITTKGANCYADVQFQQGDFLVFGSETRGLPAELLAANRERCLRIPMIPEARCLNLSNSVAIVVYEALRKQTFKQLS